MDERGKESDQGSEDDDQDGDADREAEERVIVEPAVGAGRLQIPCVSAQRLAVASLAAVEGDIAALDLEPSEQHGRVRVALDVGEGVVLAVHGNPLTWANAGRDPHEQPKCLGHGTFEGHRLVGQATVQEHRGGHECDAGNAETNDQTQHDDPQHRHSLSDLPTGR